MARYIDADELLNKLPDDLPYKASVKRVLMQAPTAEVVAESEVERLKHILNSYALQYGTVTDQHEVIDKVKTEVATEIFEGIEQEIAEALKSNYRVLEEYDDGRCNEYILELVNRVKGKIDALRGIDYFIDELKKKYTEGDNEKQ